MSRTYYWEKTHNKAPGWVTKCEQMQKGHLPLAVLWNPMADKPYCIQWAGNGHYFENPLEAVMWIAQHKPKLTPPEELIEETHRYLDEEREKERNEYLATVSRELEMCEIIIEGLKDAKPHLDGKGAYDYDKVSPNIVEGAIRLIDAYRAELKSL